MTKGSLLDLNGEVLPITTQVGVLMTRDSVVKKLDAFADEMESALDNLSRGEKVTLGRALAEKAEELRIARAEYDKAKTDFSLFSTEPSPLSHPNGRSGASGPALGFRTKRNGFARKRTT